MAATPSPVPVAALQIDPSYCSTHDYDGDYNTDCQGCRPHAVMVTPSRALVGALLTGIAKPVPVAIKIPTATTIRIVFISNVHALTAVANQAPPVRLTAVTSVVRVVMGITSVVSVATSNNVLALTGPVSQGLPARPTAVMNVVHATAVTTSAAKDVIIRTALALTVAASQGLPARPTAPTNAVPAMLGITSVANVVT